MIRVAIYEDNAGLREVLATVIRNSGQFTLAGEFGHCLDVVQNTKAFDPEVIIMDIDMPGKSGIQGVIELKQSHPKVEVIMHTVFDDDDRIFEAIRAGASGYILKKSSLSLLQDSIVQVVSGGAPMSPSIARKVLKWQQQQLEEEKHKFDLSERENQVLLLLAKGYSYKMIAEELFLSLDTIRSHIKKIYEKLHVHNVTEAVYKVFIEKTT